VTLKGKTRLLFWSLAACQMMAPASSVAKARPISVRTAYSALSAGIGTLWLTHEEGHSKKHGLDSNLIYIRGEAVRESLVDSKPQLSQADLRKFVDDRFVKAK
jgi:hypothetical protein